MEPRLIRMTAFAIAAIILLGSLSIWAVSTQETTSVGVGDVYEVDIQGQEGLEGILEPTSEDAGNIVENKDIFNVTSDEESLRDFIDGSIYLHNSGEINQYLKELMIELKADGEEIDQEILGTLFLSQGSISFNIPIENGWDGGEISISTTGNGSYVPREDVEDFELHMMIQIDEIQEIVISEEDISVDMVELEVSSTEGGYVREPGEGTFEYSQGTTIELEAVEDETSPFVEWRGDNETIEDTSANQTTIEMLEDHSITAVFDVETYDLTIDSTEGGSVVEPGEGTYTYDDGEILELEAIPETGYQFVEWTGDIGTIDESTSNQTTIEMLDDYVITAEFELITYELTIDSTEGGSVIEPGESTFEYEHGTIVDLEAIADEDTPFIRWSGDNETVEDTTSNQTTIEMLDDYTITAIFFVEPYELTIDSTEGGSVIEPGEGTYNYDSEEIVGLEAVAESGFDFVEWTGDTEAIDDPTSNETTVEMLNDYSITAEFLQEPYFEVEIVDYDDPVIEGHTVSVDYTITNTGEIEDTQDIDFTVEDQDGNLMRSVTDQDVMIGPGDTYEETFTWTTEEGDAGEYDLTVSSDDDFDEVTVTVIEAPQELYPVEELYTDNLEGEIEYLQHDPESDEAYDNWYNAIDSTEDTELEVAMDSPEAELEGQQTIKVLLRRTDNSDRIPNVNIDLYQDDTHIGTLADDLDIGDTTGEVHSFNFDATDLIDPAGENIRLDFEGEQSGGPPWDKNTIEYGAIEWEVNTVGTNTESIETNSLYDSEESSVEAESGLMYDTAYDNLTYEKVSISKSRRNT